VTATLRQVPPVCVAGDQMTGVEAEAGDNDREAKSISLSSASVRKTQKR